MHSTEETLMQKRDEKTKPVVEQFAPVWLLEQVVIPEDQAVTFDLVFQHKLYGWVNRRYRYDGFNDVLYHKGQTIIGEEQALEIESNEPYIAPLITDIPNSIGG